MIQLQNVSKIYNQAKAVDNLSFEVKEGETVVLLGTSGCGKTTTLRMINRLVERSEGEILVDGQSILKQRAAEMRRGIGYVLQHHGLFPHYTVAENIGIVPNLLGWEKYKVKARTAELLEKLQLPGKLANAYPAQLSGGQQQRIGLARALAADPPVLLMDEPFGALDPVTRLGIRKEFGELDELKRKTILMVTHDVQEAFELGDRICLMEKGKIVQIGTPAELLFRPANDFVRNFLKHQQFQLELQALSIKDVWSFLPKAIDNINEKQVPLKSVWAIIEWGATGATGDHRLVAIHSNDKRQADIASLMAAYAQFKSSVHYE